GGGGAPERGADGDGPPARPGPPAPRPAGGLAADDAAEQPVLDVAGGPRGPAARRAGGAGGRTQLARGSDHPLQPLTVFSAAVRSASCDQTRLARRRGRLGQAQGETTTLADSTRRRQGPPQDAREPLGDCPPQPQAFNPPAPRLGGAEERPEQVRQVLVSDTASLVLDQQLHASAGTSESDRDRLARRAVLAGVVEEEIHQLAQED